MNYEEHPDRHVLLPSDNTRGGPETSRDDGSAQRRNAGGTGSSSGLWIRVLQEALWFYEEPSPTEEPFFQLRHHYRFFEELFQEMVPIRTLV